MFGSGVVISPESALGKEIAKWQKPYKYEEWPRMLYKARRRPDGVIRCAETNDDLITGKPGSAEAWTGANQRVVKNEDEFLKAKGQGWCMSQDEAVERFKAEQNEVALQAAHRAHDDRNMSENAKEEAKAEEGDSFEHQPEITEKPKKRKYMRRKKEEPNG